MLGQQMWVSVGPWADSEVLKTDLLWSYVKISQGQSRQITTGEFQDYEKL